MKLLSVEQARAIWLSPTADINPTGKYLLPILVDLIKKYKFTNVPNVADVVSKNEGLLLRNGAFIYEKQGAIQVDLEIYGDGFVSETKSSTAASEAMLHEVLTWIQKEHGLQYPKNIRKQYLSKLHVETKKSLKLLAPKLDKFTRLLNAKAALLGSVTYELGGVNLTAEQSSSTVAPPIFRFERAEKIPYSANRYYSFAGLPTSDHLELLGQFENILG